MLRRLLCGVRSWWQMRTAAHRHSALGYALALFNSLLVLALAYAIAQLLFAVFAPVPPLPAAAVGHQSATQATTDVARIAAWQLFGKAQAPRPPAAPPPTTPLNLRLVGVFAAAADSRWALALIAEGEQVERAYRIGALLPGEASLQRIAPDHVVLLRHGREEILPLPQLNAVQRSAPATTALSAPPAASSGEMVERLRSELALRPDALQDLVVAAPYVENGQFIGFRLRPGRQRAAFEQLGLQGGDVLVEVNGTRLTNPAQALELAQLLLNSNPVTVRLLRNGAEVALTFD